MNKKKKFPWKALIITLVVVAVLGSAAFYALNRPRTTLSVGPTYFMSTVARGDIRVTVHGSGSLEPMNSANVYVQAAGKVENLLVEDGDIVSAGQTLAVLSDDALADQIDSIKEQIITQDATIAGLMRGNTGSKTLKAPVESRVKAIYAAEGQDVGVAMSAHNALMLLSTDGKLKVDFDPAEGVRPESGQAVKVVVGDKSVDGFVALTPDGATTQAQVQINDDTLDIGVDAKVLSADGATMGQGKLEVNRPLLVSAYSGTVDSIDVKVGDLVKAGRRLVRLDGAVLSANFEAQLVKRQQLSDDLEDCYEEQAKLTLTAPADGVVSGLALTQGAMAPVNSLAMMVQSKDSFKLVVAVDELDIPQVSVGQKATVKIDALPEAQAEGEVMRISPVGNKVNDVTTYDVTLKVNAPKGALAAMNASADVEVAFHENALLVPVEAIQTVGGRTYVYSANGDEAQAGAPRGAVGNGGFGGQRRDAGQAAAERQRIDVKVGLINDTQAEILEGLNEGDKIAVPQAESTNNMMAGFAAGGPAGGFGR